VEGRRQSAQVDVADFAIQRAISVLGLATSWLCNHGEITLPPLPVLQKGCPGLDRISDTNQGQSLDIFRKHCNASLLRRSVHSNGYISLLTYVPLITPSSKIRFSLYKEPPQDTVHTGN